MRITLNGDPHDLPGPMTIGALLARLEIDPRLVAVEYNRLVIKRARYGETMVDEGGEVEIVAFVGGGRSNFEVRTSKLTSNVPRNRCPRTAAGRPATSA